MISRLLKILGSRNQRELRRMQPLILQCNEAERKLQLCSDEALREKTTTWKAHFSAIQSPRHLAADLESILPEAFAVVKNAAHRLCGHSFTVCDQPVTWNMVHFDVQLLGGIVLHRGRIAEMSTGEGKTLVATLPVFLNALAGRGVHVVTVNDYLARRDAEWMGQLYQFLGLTVGCIQHDQSLELRRQQYIRDITYGTNSEFGFDYLRDNGMATSRAEQVQRGHYYAIIDEVDSILIDEARTPLIISGPATISTHQYDHLNPLVEQLVRKQTMLCNHLVSEAKAAVEIKHFEEAGRILFKVKLGQPRNKGLLRMMESPELRRVVEKAELSFYQDTDGKKRLIELKEELLFTIDEQQHDADLTEKGRNFLDPNDGDAFMLPDLLTEFADIDGNHQLDESEKANKKAQCQLYCNVQAERIHNISQLLKAYCLYEKDVEYVVEENKIVIVDTFTGRKMPGRRWSDGLHQAVEAKEGVQIDRETQTLAAITIQNYFRLYEKLSGMTGTGETEANEFHDIYQLDVIVIPPNCPVQRRDLNDRIYKTRREKYSAVVEEIRSAHKRKQPVLVGTASVEASELVSRMLKREGIPHTVLNAKYHRQEAEIIGHAGTAGAVTISTNMAGRGTDIKLGRGVGSLGGLYVIGTERHESRRIDRQLRGRCARQGDPGMSRFYVSFEDDLMRNFGASERMTKMMETFGMREGEELEHPLLNKSVETAQKRVEQRNYLIRRRTLEFDDVMNQQREIVYSRRNEIMDAEDLRAMIFEMMSEVVSKKAGEFAATTEDADICGLLNWIHTTFSLGLSVEEANFSSRSFEENSVCLAKRVCDAYECQTMTEDPLEMRELERRIMLSTVDHLWQEHLYALDGLREAVYLRAFGQKDPLVEYKNDAYTMFVEMMDAAKVEILVNLFRNCFVRPSTGPLLSRRDLIERAAFVSSPVFSLSTSSVSQDGEQFPFYGEGGTHKVGRNHPCPCGSGKKFKNCCGRQSSFSNEGQNCV
ncbi:Protein translocase subunit SecA [Candidatus Xiphinematobacter sp. Idaho Grape]|uniref:preprotein translocase subunit SecA n=1 Tax=Candidatus Xiphinematobacter sp. Idaho Grape TaxID=1704307 RepID=UPI000706BAEA|nr:preprotein translocase subunit SecA [Candidatus Xiphinematobacter sp. Idaho Grape]ALJ56813.1 Protein translocase subunit SecA [Candidatus Xiphinematobacter sp. Idaho Grape]